MFRAPQCPHRAVQIVWVWASSSTTRSTSASATERITAAHSLHAIYASTWAAGIVEFMEELMCGQWRKKLLSR
jgi:hypothetical protein